MIISASRRTDVPNYYSGWFLNRIKEGFVYVRNPVNTHQISRVNLSPEVVDCIVFWTKNPAGMIGRLEELGDYQYYFQFTLTGYGGDIEPGLPDKKTVLIPAFQALSQAIGRDRVIWRYDPILLNRRYTPEYHIKAFTQIARSLRGCTGQVIISFLDFYAKTKKNTKGLDIREAAPEEMKGLAYRIGAVAAENNMMVRTCCESMDLAEAGITHAACIDKALIEKLTGSRLNLDKDPNQRAECGCGAAIDVGAYDTCLSGCRYCYANYNDSRVKAGSQLYDADSPLLCSVPGPGDKLTERKAVSLKEEQLYLF